MKTKNNSILKDTLTPKAIVAQLDKYIVGQKEAKKAVAIAIRNRARRMFLSEDLKDEVAPKNIIMIGPTGVGKTEIARRFSKLADAPFTKVEATKYTEVGYVGRDVESIIRDLLNISINMVKSYYRKEVEAKAAEITDKRIIDLLLKENKVETPSRKFKEKDTKLSDISMESVSEVIEGVMNFDKHDNKSKDILKEQKEAEKRNKAARDYIIKKYKNGDYEDKLIELDITTPAVPMAILPNTLEDIDIQLQTMLGDMLPKKKIRKKMLVSLARKKIFEEEVEKLLDMDKIIDEAKRKTEESGIVFIDEIDKVASNKNDTSDVARQGVQRDILPIVEGTSVNTRYGFVKTDHILFIAAGAFHTAKPSDLMPELQGRFPIRVELSSLTASDFKKILTKPKNALTKQYQALLKTEGIDIEFTNKAIDEIAAISFEVNSNTENIGARRLHTIMEKLLEDISFNAPSLSGKIVIDEKYVKDRLSEVVKNRDLSRYIL